MRVHKLCQIFFRKTKACVVESTVMASKKNLKQFLEIESRFGSIYTGGRVKWTSDGGTLICAAGDVVNVVNIAEGRICSTLGDTDVGEDVAVDSIITFTADSTGTNVISAHRSGLLKHWNSSDGSLVKSWKSIHNGPISELALTSDGNTLVSGASDGVVRIWNLSKKSCTHALRGIQGVISVLHIFEGKGKQLLLAAGDDLKIHCWNLNPTEHAMEFTGHFSKVTGLAVMGDGKYLASSAMDKVIILWDMTSGNIIRTLPTFQALSSLAALPNKIELPEVGKLHKGLYVATAGQKGAVSIYELVAGREVYVQPNSIVSSNEEEGVMSITSVLYNENKNSIAVVTCDHNILFYKLHTFECAQQLVGFSDEILDIALLGRNDSHFAVATNSNIIKLYKMGSLGCQLLNGHKDMVLCLARSPTNPCLLVSGGKDTIVRLWELKEKQNKMVLLAEGLGHTGAVSSASFVNLCADIFITTSADTTIKVWWREGKAMSSRRTEVAHEKDINCVTVAPNDKLVATASQDKSIKLWKLDSLGLLGVLTGHKRGVWCVRFSPVDQVLLSSSADCTIRLWSVTELTCLKTFEGHESSVMRIEFLTKGMQLLSCSGDGLLKLWDVLSGECKGTFEGHDGKIWTMAVTRDEDRVVTGGSDSLLLVWKDVTTKKKEETDKQMEAMLLQEQQLSNFVHLNRLTDALQLALSLDRPFTVLNIVKDLCNKLDDSALENAVKELSNDDKERLLKCVNVWNCNAKHAFYAQAVMALLVDEVVAGELKIPDVRRYVEEALPYTQRHFYRLNASMQNLNIMQLTLRQMNPTSDTTVTYS